MARLLTTGCEVEGGMTGVNGGPDGPAGGGYTRDTATFRSGVAAFKFDSGAGNLPTSITPSIGVQAFAFVDGRIYYYRTYALCSSAPTAATGIMRLGLTNEPQVRLRTDGGVELFVAGATQGSPSALICDGTWHRLEISGTATATGIWTAAELRLDGATVATWSGSQPRNDTTSLGPGLAPGANKTVFIDDVAINDSTGAANNSWPGAGAVVLLKPTADSAVGTGWTNDNAATSSLFNSVKNTPPTGITDTTSGGGGHQIRNATSNANVNYDATMTTYTAAGVGASDTVNAVTCWAATAAPVTTGAKLGTVGIVSNPAVANVNLSATGISGAFWQGNAGGAYGTGWKWSLGTTTDAPTVTRGTAPVMRITQVTASTRIADVCGMFIYVDYTPAAVAAVIPDVGMALTVT